MIGTVHRGEIYHIHETEVTGHEQQGDRPAIIVSNNAGNEHSPVVEVVYLTTQKKKPLPTHVQIYSSPRPSTALCEQIDSVDKSRLGGLIGWITEEEMHEIDKALAISLEIGTSPSDVSATPLIIEKINEEIGVCDRKIRETKENLLINEERLKLFEDRKTMLKGLMP